MIDRSFQFRYAAMLAVVGALISLLFGGMMYAAYTDAQKGLGRLLERNGGIPPELAVQLSEADSTLMWLMVAIALMMAVALGLAGVLVTHRVAGPVHVITHYIAVLANGRYPLMRPLRKTDELKAFFDRFQSAIESMRVREAEEADVLEKAGAVFGPLAQTPEARAAVESLEAMRARKRDATDRVQVGR